MKILHLVLFNNEYPYNEMLKILQPFYKSRKDIDTYFYNFEKMDSDFKLNDNILSIKGTESYLGTTEKTIKALEFLLKGKYEYVVRSSISTIVDFDKLIPELARKSYDYAGGYINKLNWLDPPAGVIDDRYFGTEYVSGTCIILSQFCARLLIVNKTKIKYNLVDDLAIGVFFNELAYKSVQQLPNKYAFNVNEKIEDEITFYRNRSNRRSTDIANMKFIVSLLQIK